jgi:hypothetical protein
MRTILPIFAILALVTTAGSQTRNPDPCAQARLGGWKEGFAAALDEITTRLAAHDSGPIPINIDVEDLPGGDSYRLTIADLIRDNFSGKFEVSASTTPMSIYVTGMAIKSYRTIRISVRTYEPHYFLIGNRRQMVRGVFEIAGHTDVLANYGDQRATQDVRELAYKTLSDALEKLEEPQDEK